MKPGEKIDGNTVAGIVAALVLALAGIGAAVWFFVFRNRKVANKGAAPTSPLKVNPCSPEFIQSQVENALNSTSSGAQTGSVAGGHGAAAGAAIGAGTQLLNIVSGPCGPVIEKKLRDLLRAGGEIAAKASRALADLDKQRLKAIGTVWSPVTNTGKAIGQAANNVGSGVTNAFKKVFG